MNKRNTIQRALVLETVRALQCHVTAEEVYDMLLKQHTDISRGTVYRNLNLLSDIGEISKGKCLVELTVTTIYVMIIIMQNALSVVKFSM